MKFDIKSYLVFVVSFLLACVIVMLIGHYVIKIYYIIHWTQMLILVTSITALAFTLECTINRLFKI